MDFSSAYHYNKAISQNVNSDFFIQVIFSKNTRVVNSLPVQSIENIRIMNKIKTICFFILLLISLQGIGQSFNYQGVIRNVAGDVLKNKTVGIEFKILQGSASGVVVYQERHTSSTNAHGVLNLSVGLGTVVLGDFMTINWSTQNYWLAVAVDINGGTTYENLGSTKLQGVPYASYAATTGDKVFSTINNVTSNLNGNIVTDDFVFGSSQLNNDPNTTDDNSKIFFDKSKAAFRVGKLKDLDPDEPDDNELGDEWNDINVGEESIAIGRSKAAGFGSVAIGNANNLTSMAGESIAIGKGNTVSKGGSYTMGNSNNIDYFGSFAIGLSNTSSGLGAVALGFVTHAGSYSETSIGLNNSVVNGTKDAFVDTDRLFVIGNGISVLKRRDALVMLKNGNTTLNGKLTLDADNTGAGRGYTLPAQDGNANQVLSTDGSGNISWVNGVSSSFSTTNNLTSNALGDIATDDFVFGSTQLDDNTNTTDDDHRMFFDKSKGAFRVGRAWADQWNDANVERWTIAMGNASLAKGIYSVAIGDRNRANFDTSIAMGDWVITNAPNTYGLGSHLITNSPLQTSLGVYNTEYTPVGPSSFNEPTNRLLVVGNGTATVRSDALVILRNGNTTLNGKLTIDGDNQGTGTSYTLPAQDGNANQILSTDGNGNVLWVNNTNTIGSYITGTLNSANGWGNYNVAFGVTNFQDVRFRIINNIVTLEGLVRKNTAISNGDVIMTLPVGYRPLKTRIFSVQTENGGMRVDVNSSGAVVIATGFNVNQNWVSLDGITFSID